MQSVPIVGEALSLPPRYETECSVEWYHVRHSTNSPNLIRDCGLVPRGRLRASPTVSSGCNTNSPDPVYHFWLVPRGRLVAAPTMAGQLPQTGTQKRYRAPSQESRRTHQPGAPLSAGTARQITIYPGSIILSQPRISHWPSSFRPTATMEPSDFRPTVCQPPAEMATISVHCSTSHWP